MLEIKRKIKLIISDFDGIFTDGSILINQDGSTSKRLSYLDIMAVSMLIKNGYKFALVSGEKSAAIDYLANKFDLEDVYQDIRIKAPVVQAVMKKYGLKPQEVAYMGDDFNDIDATLMMEYEDYLKSNGLIPNTISFYMRNLRAVYNRAVEKGITVQRNPFRYVYTGVDKTVKRALSVSMIRKIRDLDLRKSPSMDYARDIFMFSFYTRGMSFVDMAYLKKKDLQHGVLSYRRQKTNQQLFIKWEKPMQQIIDKYDTSQTPYLLPIIKDVNSDARRQYHNASHLVNTKLKKIGVDLGLPVVLTSYVARHTWASVAHSKNISLSVISEAMGHDSENTTRIYLASLDMSVIDKANEIILKSL